MLERGKLEERGVQLRVHGAGPHSEAGSGDRSEKHCGRWISKKMNSDSRVRIPECLERGDFFSLSCHESREQEIEKKAGDRKEDHRHRCSKNPKLLDLTGDDICRHLILSQIRVPA